MALKLDGLKDVFDAHKVNNGVWIHLESGERDEETGDPILAYLDEEKTLPQRALVRSVRCDEIAKLEKKSTRTAFVRQMKARKNEKDEATASMLTTPEQRFPCILLALDNMSNDPPGVQYVNAEDALTLFKDAAYVGLVRQVQDIANEDDFYRVGSDTVAGPASEGVTAPQTPAKRGRPTT